MKYLVRLIVGILWIINKYILCIIFSVLYIIWTFETKGLEEFWKECDSAFYIKKVFGIEEYRYDTLMDFIIDNENIKHKKTW